MYELNIIDLPWSEYPENWSNILKESYSNQGKAVAETAGVATSANNTANSAIARVDDLGEQVDAIDSRVTDNTQSINTNALSIQQNSTNIESNAGEISANKALIQQNTSDIADNDSEIAKNKLDIQGNAQAITQTNQDLIAHTSANSAHGATGNIVGKQDFCTDVLGGVVLLAGNIDDLLPVVVNVADAPATYDQAHMQTVVETIRMLGQKQNDTITKINAILAGQKTAKQMSNA